MTTIHSQHTPLHPMPSTISSSPQKEYRTRPMSLSAIVYLCLVLAWAVLLSPRLLAQTASDSITPPTSYTPTSEVPKARNLNKWLLLSAPVALSLPYALGNQSVREIRTDLARNFHNRYDDYLQFVPLATQLSLQLVGVEGRSKSRYTAPLADLSAVAVMMSAVSLGKRLSAVERPDGSARNSFPSGHTAMAFTSAHLLALEYGHKHPLIAPAAYLMASSVGIGRILNNRHWVGDVAVGASVGILSAELGYALAGLITREPRVASDEVALLFPQADIRIALPISFAKDSQRAGISLRYKFSPRGYLMRVGLDAVKTNDNSPNKLSLEYALGKEWSIVQGLIYLDGYVGLGLRADSLYPSLIIAPSIRLSPRLSFEGFGTLIPSKWADSRIGFAWQYRL